MAKEGLHVLVAGRTQSKPDAVADLIKQLVAAARSRYCRSDGRSRNQRTVCPIRRQPGFMIYNTGNNTPGRIIDMDADFFAIVGVFAALVVFCLVAKRCASLLQPSAAAPCCSPAPAPSCAGALTLARSTHPRARCVICLPWQKNTHKTAYMLPCGGRRPNSRRED